jgi:hypothetical protein
MDENTPFTCEDCDWAGPFAEVFDHTKQNPGHVATEVLDDPGASAVRIEVTRKQES